MKTKETYQANNFRRFDVTRGTEILKGTTMKAVAVRSDSIVGDKGMIEADTPLLVTAAGEEGTLFLRPQEILSLVKEIRPLKDNNTYELYMFEWIPISFDVIDLLEDVYTLKKSALETINKMINYGCEN